MEVTPAQAERVSVASRIGRLSLAVRSADRPSPGPSAEQSGTTWASDVSPALGTNAARGSNSGTVLHVFPGAGDHKEFRF